MSTLLARIAFNAHRQPEPQSNDLRVVGTLDSATQTPLSRIQIFPGVVAYDEGLPLISADGAPISGTGPGQWGQLYAAGRI